MKIDDEWTDMVQRAETAETALSAAQARLASALDALRDIAQSIDDKVEPDTASGWEWCCAHANETLDAPQGTDGEDSVHGRQQKYADLVTAAGELWEVAELRGDSDLPHPADDDTLWTARMQTAWDEFGTALAKIGDAP